MTSTNVTSGRRRRPGSTRPSPPAVCRRSRPSPGARITSASWAPPSRAAATAYGKIESVRILFVCLCNICRSPTAAGVLRMLAAREGPELTIEGGPAGTAGYHVGDPPDPRTRQAAARRGYDLSGLRARIVEPGDFERF